MMKHILHKIGLRRKKRIIETPDFGEMDELDPEFKMLFQEVKKKKAGLDYNGKERQLQSANRKRY